MELVCPNCGGTHFHVYIPTQIAVVYDDGEIDANAYWDARLYASEVKRVIDQGVPEREEWGAVCLGCDYEDCVGFFINDPRGLGGFDYRDQEQNG